MAVDASIEVSSDGGLAAPVVVVVFKQENGKERNFAGKISETILSG